VMCETFDIVSQKCQFFNNPKRIERMCLCNIWDRLVVEFSNLSFLEMYHFVCGFVCPGEGMMMKIHQTNCIPWSPMFQLHLLKDYRQRMLMPARNKCCVIDLLQ